MTGRIGSTSPALPPTPFRPYAPPPSTVAPPLVTHTLPLTGTPTGPVDSYTLSTQTGVTRKPPHEVGTRVHGALPRLQYQHASAGLTHTRGDGTPGVHHQQLDAHATLAHVKHERTGTLGPVDVHTEAQAALFDTRAEAGLRLNTRLQQPQVILHGYAHVLSGAQASVTGHVGRAHLGASVQAEAHASARASAQASAVFDPLQGSAFVQAGVSASASASASAGGSAQVGPLVLSGRVGASAGVGYTASVNAGLRNGVVGASVGLGASLGAGASASVGAGIDTTWRPHLPSWAHATPSGPQLTRSRPLGPPSARAAAQAVAGNPGPQLTRSRPLGPQSAQTAAQAVAQAATPATP